MKPNTLFAAILTLAGLSLALPVQATTTYSYSWNLDASGTETGAGTYGNTRTYAGTGTPSSAPANNVVASAWADTTSGTSTTSATTTNSTLNSAYLGYYAGNGLGVSNQYEGKVVGPLNVSAPNHAMDNASNYDSIEFKFDSATTLSKVTLGYPSATSTYDSDISILAWIGTGSPILSGNKYVSLVGDGWKVIGNYCNVATLTNQTINFTTGVSSSYWIVAAYNNVFGADCIDAITGKSSACNTPTTNFDYVKVKMLAGSTPPPGVPEPATLLLFGAGLLGLVRMRRQ
ncbi:hypothetical protein SCT_2641 [Sulfuricella sp. T08]|uniref:exosortase-dependent surface protein XDP1 n=1 Tax=Sulfuricella sp. T08 TaxID=1632857 RepID=UPI0006179A08|nr:exosortase-dependent surface protein XDP1 [Sulfuricella sp. T08]GAO37223.1 hypothetical protein SCT_2641 [Sulfuricella sp. T08]